MNDVSDGATNMYTEKIVLVSISDESYFLYRGEDHVNQLLLADGEIPLPVRCLRFASIIDIKLKLGEAVNVSQYWAIHPDIVARLRNNEQLIETDA